MRLPLRADMPNAELADVLAFISEILALKGENRFRVRAYQNAAVIVEQLGQPLREMFTQGYDLEDLPGIGETLKQKFTELFTTGDIKAFQTYVKPYPESMYELCKVPGIGAKKAFKLTEALHINEGKTAIDELIVAAQAGRIRTLPSFGEKSEAELLTSLQNYKARSRIPYKLAYQIGNSIKEELITSPDIERAELLGSLRRQSSTVGDIDIGIAVKNIGRVKNFVKSMKNVKRMVIAGDQVFRLILANDFQVDIKVAKLSEWGSFLQHYTGSKEHNIKLREFALKQGKSLSEHGIKETNAQTGLRETKLFASEESFYKALGLKLIPPPERLGQGEIERYRL